jgi:hypothetical protein
VAKRSLAGNMVPKQELGNQFFDRT